jgi:hypothetical protein
MGAASAVLGGAGVIGSIAASDQARQAARSQRRAAEQAMNIVGAVELPDIEKQKLVLEQLAATGEYTPEMLQALSLDPSAMEQISIDPRLKSAQMEALGQLGELSKGGLSASDAAAFELARRQTESAAQARDQQLMQNLQQRGINGGGAKIAMRRASGAEASDRQNMANLEILKAAQQRALEALSQSGNLAGSIRGQEYGEQSDLARSRDIINQFNTENQQRTQQANVGLRNQAQASNLQERQRIADANVATRNMQQQQNKGLLQRDYENRMAKAQGMAGLQSNIGAAQAGEHQALGQLYSNLAGSAIGAAGKMYSPSGKNISKLNISDNTDDYFKPIS